MKEMMVEGAGAMTFQELMDCWNRDEFDNNRDTYNRILEQAKKKNLVPVIGAGLSAWVEYPMWDELLRRHAVTYGAADQVNALLAEWKYDEAAEVMMKVCGAARWRRILGGAFDPKMISQRRANRPRYQQFLPKLFEGLVLTTNFDRCLEDLYDDDRSIQPGDDFQVEWAQRAAFSGEHLLIKLHGDIQYPEKMVLTKTSYDHFYGSDPKEPDLTLSLPKYLAERVGQRPMLFLGCSLHQDRTCAVLGQCAGSREHFALLPVPKPEQMEARCRELTAMDIYPIWYEAGKHDEALTAFFTQLAADCGIREKGKDDSPVYPLVGRDQVIAQLYEHYSGSNPEPRWVTGVAGIGKTEVCRAVIRQLEKEKGRSMPMVDCTNADRYSKFYDAVARGLGLDIPPQEAADPADYLLRLIPEQVDGVYFDNFEDIWRGVADDRDKLGRWLLALRRSGVDLLFSSQDGPDSRALGLKVSLEQLDKGVIIDKLNDEEFQKLDSVKLFTNIYGDVEPEELGDFRKLIRQMEGHPLAIVLTANQASQNLMGMRTLLGRWDAVQRVYTGNPKHTSLKNALALVWDEIKDDPGAVFCWGLHATCVQPIPLEFHPWLILSPELEAGMERLQTGSLVRRVDRHITMFLPVKNQLPLLETRWESMRPFFLRYWAKTLSKLLDRANDGSNPNRLEAHRVAVELMPQVCHVLDGLAKEGEAQSDDLLMLLYSAQNHFMYYLTSGDTLKHLVGHPSQDICGFAYKYLGDVLRFQGELSDARDALERAAVQCEKAGNFQTLADALLSKAELLRSMEDYEGAAATLGRAEKLYSDVVDDLGMANILLCKGDVLRCQNKYKEAEDAYRGAEEKYRVLNSSMGLANVLQSRGVMLFSQEEYEKALKPLEEAYDIYRELLLVDDQAQCQCFRYLCLMQTDRAGEAEAIRPQLEAMLPDLPPPVQRLVQAALSYPTQTP